MLIKIANYKRDKLGRREKTYREKLKRDALKDIEPIEKKPFLKKIKKINGIMGKTKKERLNFFPPQYFFYKFFCFFI